MAAYKNREEALAAEAERKKNPNPTGETKLIRDENTGRASGVIKPSGETTFGVDDKTAKLIASKDVRSATFADQTTQKTEQIQPEITTPIQPEVSQQDIQNVGNFNPEINPNTVLSGDDALRQLYTDTLNNAMSRGGNKAVGVTDFLYDVIPGGKYKKALIENIITDPEKRAYLSGYSNEDNMNAIINNLALTDKDIENAKFLATIPGFKKQAIETYKKAQAKKQLFYTQLKILSSKDQRAYTSKAKDEMTEILSYWESGKVNDDIEMQEQLSKVPK